MRLAWTTRSPQAARSRLHRRSRRQSRGSIGCDLALAYAHDEIATEVTDEQPEREDAYCLDVHESTYSCRRLPGRGIRCTDHRTLADPASRRSSTSAGWNSCHTSAACPSLCICVPPSIPLDIGCFVRTLDVPPVANPRATRLRILIFALGSASTLSPVR